MPLVIFMVLFFMSAGFAVWAFLGRQDFKNNSDKKSAEAVAVAIKKEDTRKDAEFAEAEKSPYKSYTGAATYGSLSFQYPKTWSAYIAESTNSSMPIDGYFAPNFVPDLKSDTSFALRAQILGQSYATVLATFNSAIQKSGLDAKAFRAEKVPSVLGTILQGQIIQKKNGIIVLLPLRDKTIKIWTEGDDFKNDFMKIIVPSISFTP